MMTLKTLFLHPLGPALVLFLGGTLLGLLRAAKLWPALKLPPWFLRLRAAATLATVAGAGLVLGLLRLSTGQAELRWAWQPLTVAGSSIVWRLESWNWLVAIIILLLTAISLLLDPPTRPEQSRRGGDERTLLLGGAALVFVFSGNVVTLATSWVLLDLLTALRLHPGERQEPSGRAWMLLSISGLAILGVMELLAESGIRANLTAGPFGSVELGLLWMAGLVRAGVYPLHLWLIGPGRTDSSDRVALHLIGPTTGLWLLAQVHDVAGAGWLRRPEWAALGALALLGTAMAAWTASDEGWRWRWIVLNRAALVVMAAYMSEWTGPQALVWATVTFSLGGALLAVGQSTRRQWGWSLPAGLGALAIWGIPGTPGFLARFVLVLPTGLAVAIPLYAVILVAEALLAAALWQVVVGREMIDPAKAKIAPGGGAGVLAARPAWGTIARHGIALALVAAPIIAWGIAPIQLANLAGLPPGDAFPALGWALVSARRSVWAGLVISGLLGIGLGVARRHIFTEIHGWQRAVTAIVSLEWLFQIMRGAFAGLASGVNYFAALGEGEGYLGWLALAALILWVLLRS